MLKPGNKFGHIYHMFSCGILTSKMYKSHDRPLCIYLGCLMLVFHPVQDLDPIHTYKIQILEFGEARFMYNVFP